MQKVTLVLGQVPCFQELNLAVDKASSCIVACCQQITAQSFGMRAKCAELDFAVTEHIGVGRSSAPVFLKKI